MGPALNSRGAASELYLTASFQPFVVRASPGTRRVATRMPDRRSPSFGVCLLCAGLLTPHECPTAGLLPSECALGPRMPLRTGPTTRAGALRSGWSAG